MPGERRGHTVVMSSSQERASACRENRARTEAGWVKVNDRGLSQRLQTEAASVQRSEVGVARSVLCPASPGAAAGRVATARALVATHDDDGVWMRADRRRRERRRPSRTVQDDRLRYPHARRQAGRRRQP